MRFKRFPRTDRPAPSARRLAAARRSVQAGRDRYPLFPEGVRYESAEARLSAVEEDRVHWWAGAARLPGEGLAQSQVRAANAAAHC
jgi:hypothetical protein